MKKALIIKLIGGIYTFVDLTTYEKMEGYAKGKFRKMRVSEDSSFNVNIGLRTKKDIKDIVLSPKVGDIIAYELVVDTYFITDIYERKNELVRPDIANVDQVLLIFSATQPDFSFHLLDKFLVILEIENLKPIIVVTKISLLEEEKLNELKNDLKYYEEYYNVYYIDSKENTGIKALEKVFKDKITVLAGQTGVGKSTFMNALMPELNLKTQQISRALGRGKHTTRHLELFLYKEGYIADTPGFSKIELSLNDYQDLKNFYIDFNNFYDDCRFKNKCLHINEPGCKIKELVSNNEIPEFRYQNYLDFITEIKNKKQIY